jgi:hypothetical protein
VAPKSKIERDLQQLAVDLKQLEAEYNMFFSGRLPKPPWETRAKIDVLVKQYDRAYIQNYGERFRFQTLQARYAAFIDLWDKGLRAREEGRPGPFAQKIPDRDKKPAKPQDRIVHVAAFRDPMREMDKLHDLYDSLSDARSEVGVDNVPFHKFVELVKGQVKKFKETGAPEVAFRVAVKDGKVNFTARGLKGASD